MYVSFRIAGTKLITNEIGGYEKAQQRSNINKEKSTLSCKRLLYLGLDRLNCTFVFQPSLVFADISINAIAGHKFISLHRSNINGLCLYFVYILCSRQVRTVQMEIFIQIGPR